MRTIPTSMQKSKTTEHEDFKTIAVDGLVDALEKAAKQFSFYEEQHMKKNPPDTAKAKTNQEYSVMCYEAIINWESVKND